MESQWDGSRTLVGGTQPTNTEDSNIPPVRSESGRKESSSRGSFDKKYQPDLGHYSYSSKLDKINNKREEELKIATTLIGEMAGLAVLREQHLPPSPEKLETEVSNDAKQTNQDSTDCSLQENKAIAATAEEAASSGDEADDGDEASNHGDNKDNNDNNNNTIGEHEKKQHKRGAVEGTTSLYETPKQKFKSSGWESSSSSSPSPVGDGNTPTKRPRGRPRKFEKDRNSAGGGEEGSGGYTGEASPSQQQHETQERGKRDEEDEDSEQNAASGGEDKRSAGPNNQKPESNREEGRDELSGDSPAEEEDEWDGGSSQNRNFDSKTKRVGWRRSSRLSKDTGGSKAGEEEDEEGSNPSQGEAGENTEQDATAKDRGGASKMDEESDDEKAGERIIEDMLKMRNFSKPASTSKSTRGRKRKNEQKRGVGKRGQDSNDDEDFVGTDGAFFDRRRGTRRNPPRGEANRGAGGKGKSTGDSGGEEDKDEKKIFCLCRSPADDEFMICCDVCGEWFHGRCVNITAEEAESIEIYTCPLCIKKNGSGPSKKQRKNTSSSKESSSSSSKTKGIGEIKDEKSGGEPLTTKRFEDADTQLPVNDDEQDAIATLLAATGRHLFKQERKKRKKRDDRDKKKKRKAKEKKHPRKRKGGSGSDRERERSLKRKAKRPPASIDALTHAALNMKNDLFSPSGGVSMRTAAGNQHQSRQPPLPALQPLQQPPQIQLQTQHSQPPPHYLQQQQHHQHQPQQQHTRRPPPVPIAPLPVPSAQSPPVPIQPNSAVQHSLPLRDDAGVKLWDYFFDKEQSDYILSYLYKEVSWKQNKMEFFGGWYNEPRTVACYGDPGLEYRTNGTVHSHLPWTDLLLEVKKRVEDVLHCSFNSVFLTKYMSGLDCSNWESENDVTLSTYQHPNTITLSFGEERQFFLRKKSDARVNDNECYEVKLQHGTMMLLWGTTLGYYEQALPKAHTQGVTITMTFRQLNSEASLSSSAAAVAQHSMRSNNSGNTSAPRPIDSRDGVSRMLYEGGYPSPPSWVGDIWGHSGDVKNGGVGQIFGSLGELVSAGIHAHAMSSVAGSKTKGTESVVLSNDGCVRSDNGDVVFFCVPTDIGDGELAAMMLTALERCKTDHAVRLVRSWKAPSNYAPKEEGSYRYDGLYKITTVWMEKSKDSAADLCAFRLEREKGQPPLPHPSPPVLGESKEDLEAWRFNKLREFEEEMIRKGLISRGNSSPAALLATILPPRSPIPPPYTTSVPSPPTGPLPLSPLPSRSSNNNNSNSNNNNNSNWPRSPSAPPSKGGPTSWYPSSNFSTPPPFHSSHPSNPSHPFPLPYRGSNTPNNNHNSSNAPPLANVAASYITQGGGATRQQPFPPSISPASGGGGFLKPPLGGGGPSPPSSLLSSHNSLPTTNIINNINNTINVINNINNPNTGTTPTNKASGIGKDRDNNSNTNNNPPEGGHLSIYLPPPFPPMKKGGGGGGGGGGLAPIPRPSEEIDLTDEQQQQQQQNHPKPPHV